ncbi:rhomboid family intramembrane serine protease [Lederbergia wuyishanensis]|uniref:Membrane associated rhomboid family serine protease n=1 Tax=Lederbergia wuyishanensis TaxID=1347903 RepID=A0ABU0DA47_9BACI|nr:rhomboid family intramembrane serine protease [Lederbergia wuyishanensis]MCJ8008495.1 rhomboid family intramembrane serine protease [Lederbergia wuyishanensis]MDQ0345238.1 membrane associated rhomboid family serine protease [Lederbergia wuyishanensis]
MFVRTESFGQFLRSYPVVSSIIAIHILIFLMMHLPIFPHNWILELLAGVNLYIQQGEYWRLVTPIFVHVAFAHLLFNSFSLVLFGPALEKALGKIMFIIVYLASGIGANIATLYIHPPYYTHIGASGAIFGLFGVYLAVLFVKKDAMPLQGRQVILPIAIISVVLTFFQPGVNITGHIFGLISGLLIGRILLHFRSIRF